MEEDGPDSWEGRPLGVGRANTKGFRSETKIASATSGETDGSPHPSPSPTRGTRRPGSEPRRRDAGGFDHEDGAEQNPKPSARGTRALAATIAVLPFAVLGALVVVYLAWSGTEMGARTPGRDGLLFGIVASVAVSFAAILIGSWAARDGSECRGPRVEGLGGEVCPTMYTSDTPNKITGTTMGIPIPNSSTMRSEMSSRSANHGKPGLPRRTQANTSMATAPTNTTTAAASIHHHSNMML